ncbi:helix-turn-helix transcriptional regulator [Proteiniborus sp. MB09-C3]|uniref:helix-turn-helix domain-containing protein n=1 Tax=Proteiniborus sp. MB09-C3 TaxID=3050072 RepID=UPI00255779CA|nr:helix-turn-helix transcriptional regulator [Proteiniborus sp. MB09-C3]WIV13365.1 helix-turn-helix transcriptional regulator [Proteiniborus sp. MB09-C3]
MYHYNLNLFGKELRRIRKQFKLTLRDVSELSGVNCDTLGRIESGKVIPKYETLEFLSPIYKQDINTLFLKYRINNYSIFYDIQAKLEAKIDRDEFNTLDIEVKALEKLPKFIIGRFYKNYIEQMILLAKAIILYKNKHENDDALNKLTEAMKLTNPSFILDDYNSFIYSPMEIRILMNMALVLNRLDNSEKHLEIMEFCIDTIKPKNEIYPKICHNLSSAYMKNKNYKKTLELSLDGIKACQRYRNYYRLSLLYYDKGIAEYELNKNEYIQSLKTSLTLCDAFGQAELKNTIIKKCKNILE